MFRIDLTTLVDCLTIFDGCTTTPGTTTALKMTYKGYGHSLKIMYLTFVILQLNEFK